MSFTIKIVTGPTTHKKPALNELGFGKYFTDHMFVMDYDEGIGWHDPTIVPFQNISVHPAAKVLHYGQSVFEGMKAYRTRDGRVLLFRPDKNVERLNLSNERLSIPPVDPDFVLHAIKTLVSLEREWIPTEEGTSLYIRPFVISTEADLGVSPSTQYRFIIILSPVGAYYAEGMNPTRIYVEDQFVRAVRGGTGAAKTGGNYASSLRAQEVAHDKGYSQVLWLDAIEHKYIEEVGSMNVFFKLKGEVVTPILNGSILPGVTRDSVIRLLEHMDVPVVERRLSMAELYEAHQDGQLEEAFGTGTAAVISPIGQLDWNDQRIVLEYGQTGVLWKQIYDTLTGIQTGLLPDPFGWTMDIDS